jgi:hypothetical protein
MCIEFGGLLLCTTQYSRHYFTIFTIQRLIELVYLHHDYRIHIYILPKQLARSELAGVELAGGGARMPLIQVCTQYTPLYCYAKVVL